MRKKMLVGIVLGAAGGCTSTNSATLPGAGPDGGPVGCAFGEPNDVRESAALIELNRSYSGLCVSSPDGSDAKDFFEFVAPNDAAGGYVEVQMTNVASQGLAEFIVTSVVDNDVLVDSYQTTEGASDFGWFTVSPGAHYRVQVNRFGGSGTRFTYDLALKYTAIVDSFEPNNTKETAKDIQVGVDYKASAAAHSPKAVLVAGDDSDWYKVGLAAGNRTITVSTVPSDHLCDVELLDSTGNSVGENYNTTPGANCQIDAQNLTAGTYYIHEHRFAGQPDRGASGQVVPNFVKGQYTLQVK